LASETEKESGVSDDVTDAVEQALTKAAEEILSLRQRVAGLEETLEKHGHVNLFRQNWIEKLEAELAALKAGQGEPVAWVSREFEGLVGWHISLLPPDGTQLYTSAPTIPEGWQEARECILRAHIALSNRRGESHDAPRERADLAQTELESALKNLAAAPKPEE
jgi:hypothetical protein